MTVLIPLPLHDFDPTEAAVPWKILRQAGIPVQFATSSGEAAAGDQRMLSGAGLGPWKPLMRADHNGLAAYQEMRAAPEFLKPLMWSQLAEKDFTALLLPGGHAPGMREYLESPLLHRLVTAFFATEKLVGAICHGVVLAARAKSAEGKSILYRKQTTALLKSQEMLAWGLTCLWLKNYYRTYPESVQDEVTRALESPTQFQAGPLAFLRDSPEHLERGFCVEDQNFISARWPGDAHHFGTRFLKRHSDLKLKKG